MQLAARSYLAAGVALVGASAIAVSPMAPSVPATSPVHMPVALTSAIDNPLTVFEPAFTATQTMISNIIERQTTNPAPIPRQLLENAVAGYQAFMSTPPAWQIAKILADGVIAAQNFGPNLAALGETTSAAGTALSEALSQLAAGLPAGLEAAAANGITGTVPPRDIVFAFLADEENGGVEGSQLVVRDRPEWFAGATEAISEVGGYSIPVGDRRAYLLQVGEKALIWIRLVATGRAVRRETLLPGAVLVSLDAKQGTQLKTALHQDDGSTIEFDAKVRIDTPGEAEYYRNGGILQYVLRSMLKS